MSSSFDIPADLMAGFLDEAPTYLTTLEDRLLSFEDEAHNGTIAIRDESDTERMHEIFRAAHSLKGLAASLGFNRIRDVTHIMESIFDQLRGGKRELSGSDVEGLFSVVDVLRELVRELTAPTESPIDIQPHLDRLSGILNCTSAPLVRLEGPVAAKEPAAAPRPSRCEDPELLARFVEATLESLDEANEHLLTLEKTPDDGETINAIFRCAHNIKGACGAVGCETLQALTHDFETVLDRIRGGMMQADATLITAMLKATDRIRTDVESIARQRCENVTSSGMPGLFDRWLGAQSAPCLAAPDPDVTVIVVDFPKGFSDAPIQACILHNRLSDLGEIVHTEPNVDALETSSVVERMTIRLRTEVAPSVLERVVRAYAIESVTIQPPSPQATDPSSASTGANAPPQLSDAKETAESTASDHAAGERRETAEKPVDAAKAGETVRVDLERLDQLMNLGGELVITRARFSQIRRRLTDLLPRSDVAALVDRMADSLSALRVEIERATGAAGNGPMRRGSDDPVRNLEADLGRIRGILAGIRDARGAMAEFNETVHSLNRITDSMQKRIMQTRMVPIGPLFQRFRRVVRDIAKATDKRVELVIHGEQTELDKRMIDELVDPLTHMIRNSVDHGVESPAQRRAAGKPEVASVTLNAFHRGRNICVQVSDDGRGVDVGRVRRKIVEREIATQALVDALSDHEVIQYVFRAGFSTADAITDLSGRGMGMDIVRDKIEGVNGNVELRSVPGEGTCITVNLPLTLAIINAMLARVGSIVYAIPLDSVGEILAVRRSSIRSVSRRPVIQVREQVVPLAFIEQILDIGRPEQRTCSAHLGNLTVVLVGQQSQRIGLVVDELLGQEDIVIRDIASNFRNVQGLAGASIMGDGSVALILDVAALMTGFAERAARMTLQSPAAPQPAVLGARE